MRIAFCFWNCCHNSMILHFSLVILCNILLSSVIIFNKFNSDMWKKDQTKHIFRRHKVD